MLSKIVLSTILQYDDDRKQQLVARDRGLLSSKGGNEPSQVKFY